MQKPFPAFEGDDHYVFVCYSHDDADLVYPEIKRLHEAGFNIWYDEGVSPGSEWSESLANHIQHCAVFLYFVTPQSVHREHCRQEINFALDQGKQILAVHLKPTQVPPALQLNLGHRQAILKHEHSKRVYEQKLDRALRDAIGGNEPIDAGREQTTASIASAPRRYVQFGAAALVLFLVVAATWWLNRGQSDGPTVQTATMADHRDQPPTIAVLPLKNLSGDEAQAYFGEAVSSEIWAKLTRVEGLRVISMTSSSAYRDSDLDIRDIAQRLTADLMVEGTAMKTGNLARVNVHLTDAQDGSEIWGKHFARSIDQAADLFALYDSIAADIGRSLPSYIHGTDALHTSSTVPTGSIAAYNLIKRAQYEMGRTGDPGESLRLAEQAVALDPQYAGAHSAVAAFNVLMAEFGYARPRKHLIEAEAAARRALAIDAGWANAYLVLGIIYDRLHLDWSRAMEAYEKAEALGASPDGLAGSKQDLLLNAGRYDQGLKLVREAAARNPGLGMWRVHMGRFLYRLGRPDEARENFEHGLDLSPTNAWGYSNRSGTSSTWGTWILRSGPIASTSSLFQASWSPGEDPY